MKRVLILVMALLVFSMITTAMASAIEIPVSGSFTGSATAPGESWITNDNILQIKDAEGAGPSAGDLPGYMEFTLSGDVDLNTGLGSAHGKWVLSDDHGTIEGTWRVDVTSVVFIEGSAVGKGTGDYMGMLFKVDSFWGYNLYLGGYEGPDGVHFDFLGTILSTKGEPLP
jgi:hypothetical protein